MLVRILTVVTLLAVWSLSEACDCVGGSLVSQSAVAQVIMVAQVESGVPYSKVVVRPLEVLKGQVARPISITTGSSMCDYFLTPAIPVGGKYLLFLTQQNEKFSASRCFETGPVAEKAAELEVLRTLLKR